MSGDKAPAKGQAKAKDKTRKSPKVEMVAGMAPRLAAIEALDAVLRRQRPLDEALPAALKADMEPRDRGLAHALATISLRRYGQIRHILDQRLERGMPGKSGMLEAILITGAAQILFMDVQAHAAVDLAVRIARLSPHSAGYAALVNAVLRGLDREKPELPSAVHALPQWLGMRWRKAYGAVALPQMAAMLLEEPPLDLTARDDAAHWAGVLEATLLPTGTLRLARAPGPIPAMAGFDDGAWWAQDAGALLPVLALGDVKGLRVLDLCAAPGGKTAALAARGADVVALDRSSQRMKRVEENLARLKLAAELVVADGSEWPKGRSFDAILVDAPCSSTGTLRRHPDVGHIKSEKDIVSLAGVQARLLDAAAGAVKPGGRLVYSTCSLEPEEGEHQARKFLARHKDYRIEPISADEIGGFAELVSSEGWLRSLPHHLAGFGGVDGFFVVRFVRCA